MTVLSTHALDPDVPKIRWLEPYVTAGLNQKTLGQYPKGVFAGFTVVADPTPGSIGVVLQVDPTLGFSGANVLDVSTDKYCVTLIQEDDVGVDLSSFASTTVYITLDAQYQIGVTSAAQIKIVDAAELGLNSNLVLLAKVSVPSFSPLVQSQINTAYRNAAGDALPLEARPQINLINNGTFEGDLAGSPPVGWANYAGVAGPSLNPTVDATVFRSPSLQSLKLSSVADAVSGFACTPISVTSGQTLRGSVWIRSSNVDPIADGSGVFASIVFLDSGYSEISSAPLDGAFTGNGTTWVQRQGVGVAPANATYAQLLVSFDGCKGTLYIDDAELTARGAESLAQSAVFGGTASIADAYHLHTASGSAYAGGPNWADGTPNPPTTVEGQLDKILGDLAGASGAPKVGNAPSKILHNIFVNSVANTSSIDATGNGTATGIIGRGGASNGSGLEGVGVGTGTGGILLGAGAAAPTLTGQGGVAVGAASGSPDGFYAAGGSPNGTGLHGVGTGTGNGVFGEAQTGQNGVGVRGLGHGTGSGGVFLSGADSTGGTAALTAQAQGANSVGLNASSTGNQPAIYAQSGTSGTAVVGFSPGGVGGDFSAGGNHVGVLASGGGSGGYGILAAANGGNTPGVFGQGFGSAGAITAQGDPRLVGTDTVRPNGFGGGGGDGAETGGVNSHGGDGADIQGGSAEFLPAPSSSSTPFPRGSAGHGIIGRAGSGRVPGHGVYGFGGLGYDNGSDPFVGPGYGVLGQGQHSDGQIAVLANANASHGVAGIGGDANGGMTAGDGVRGQGGTDTDLNGLDGSCFLATPANARSKALLIQGNTASIAYQSARAMTCTVLGSAFKGISDADRLGNQAGLNFDDTQGLVYTSFGVPSEYRGYAQFRLPLNAVVTGVTLCLTQGGQAHYAGSFFRISKQFPSGTSIGGTLGGVANNNTINASFSVGASTQALSIALGTLSERTVTAVDQAFTAFFEIQPIDASGGLTIKYLKIDYNMFDWLYLP